MPSIFALSSTKIRSTPPSKLKLPKTPANLNSLSKSKLLRALSLYGDYFASWLERASMLPEVHRYSDFSVTTLRQLIRLCSGPFAQKGWPYHDYKQYGKEHDRWYNAFHSKFDAIVSKEKKTKTGSHKRMVNKKKK